MGIELSEVLKNNKDKILTYWESEIKSFIPAARLETKASLRDSIPVFLDELAVALKNGLHQVKPDIIKFAHKHGSERANLSEYSIEDALTEYNILRKIIFNILEAEATILPDERDIILEAIDFGMKKAGSEYAKHSAKELNILFELSGTGKAVVDPTDGTFIKINGTFAKMLGYTENEILAADFLKITHPEDVEFQKKKLQENTDNRELSSSYLKRMVRKDGSTFWAEIHTSPLPGTPDHPIRNISTIIDVTNKKMIEEEQERTKDKLKKITDIQPSLIGHVDKNLRYLFVNKTYEDWFKIPVSEFPGMHVRDAVGEEAFSILEPYFKRALKGEKVIFESKLRYRSNITRSTISTYSPDFDQFGKVQGVYVSVVDNTEQRKHLEDLQNSEAIRDRFMSALSHDLRTPLTSAILSAQLILRKTKDTAVTTLCSKVEQSLKRVDKMIEDLLDANRLRAGQKIHLKIQETDLSDLVRITIHDLETIYGDRFVVDIPEKFTTYLAPLSIRRIIENLCTNAIKYGSAAAPVSIYINPDHDKFELGVRNFGNPLEKREMGNIFEQFVRAKKDESGEKKGWGIGLSIVKGVTEAHGGEVSVDSDDSGTTFKVLLPIDARPFTDEELQLH
jgi:PAS domain S-box-containing protein